MSKPSFNVLAAILVLLVAGTALTALTIAAVNRLERAESLHGEIVEIADVRSQLLRVASETQRLDALSMRDVLSEETLYGDPDRTERELRTELGTLASRIHALEIDPALFQNIRTSAEELVRSAQEQLALKTTEPREIEQHDDVARTSLVSAENLISSVRDMDARLYEMQERAVLLLSEENAGLFRLILAYIAAGVIVAVTILLLTGIRWWPN